MNNNNIHDINDHMALTCACGSVNFALLRSGRVECNGCSAPTSMTWASDEEAESPPDCRACCGKGWNDEWRRVPGHYLGGEEFRIRCDECDGTGKEGVL